MKYKFIINLKTYKESLCDNSIYIAKICKSLEKKAKEKNVEIILCPSMIDIKDCVRSKVKTYSQHIDDYNYGAHTGHIIPNAIKCAGASGTLINHSEHRINLKTITKNIEILNSLNLESCVCTENPKEVKKISKLSPSFIAVEPKELIGGNISVSTAKPKLIEKSVKNSNNVPILVGAGIKNSQDVKKAIELGAKGILVASGVVKAKDIKKAIEELLSGF